MAPNDTIVCHMRAYHKEIVAANLRHQATTFGPRIHRNVFTHDVSVPNTERRRFTAKF